MTARLSKHFYERLGEQVANELVDWFNAVDATYKAELRELNDSNFARFEAKMEQRFAEFDRRFGEFEAKFERRLSEIRTSLEDKILAQTRFMYLAWVTVLATVIGFGLR